MRLRVWAGSALLAASLAGGAMAEAAGGPGSPRAFAAGRQATFEAVVGVLRELKFTVSGADAQTGRITVRDGPQGAAGEAVVSATADGRTGVRLTFSTPAGPDADLDRRAFERLEAAVAAGTRRSPPPPALVCC